MTLPLDHPAFDYNVLGTTGRRILQAMSPTEALGPRELGLRSGVSEGTVKRKLPKLVRWKLVTTSGGRYLPVSPIELLRALDRLADEPFATHVRTKPRPGLVQVTARDRKERRLQRLDDKRRAFGEKRLGWLSRTNPAAAELVPIDSRWAAQAGTGAMVEISHLTDPAFRPESLGELPMNGGREIRPTPRDVSPTGLLAPQKAYILVDGHYYPIVPGDAFDAADVVTGTPTATDTHKEGECIIG